MLDTLRRPQDIWLRMHVQQAGQELDEQLRAATLTHTGFSSATSYSPNQRQVCRPRGRHTPCHQGP